MVEFLMGNPENIFIRCHAGQFVRRNGLAGLCSGMFISEVGEGICYGFDDIDGYFIDESNYGFSSIVSKFVIEPMDILYRGT